MPFGDNQRNQRGGWLGQLGQQLAARKMSQRDTNAFRGSQPPMARGEWGRNANQPLPAMASQGRPQMPVAQPNPAFAQARPVDNAMYRDLPQVAGGMFPGQPPPALADVQKPMPEAGYSVTAGDDDPKAQGLRRMLGGF